MHRPHACLQAAHKAGHSSWKQLLLNGSNSATPSMTAAYGHARQLCAAMRLTIRDVVIKDCRGAGVGHILWQGWAQLRWAARAWEPWWVLGPWQGVQILAWERRHPLSWVPGPGKLPPAACRTCSPCTAACWAPAAAAVGSCQLAQQLAGSCQKAAAASCPWDLRRHRMRGWHARGAAVCRPMSCPEDKCEWQACAVQHELQSGAASARSSAESKPVTKQQSCSHELSSPRRFWSREAAPYRMGSIAPGGPM